MSQNLNKSFKFQNTLLISLCSSLQQDYENDTSLFGTFFLFTKKLHFHTLHTNLRLIGKQFLLVFVALCVAILRIEEPKNFSSLHFVTPCFISCVDKNFQIRANLTRVLPDYGCQSYPSCMENQLVVVSIGQCSIETKAFFASQAGVAVCAKIVKFHQSHHRFPMKFSLVFRVWFLLRKFKVLLDIITMQKTDSITFNCQSCHQLSLLVLRWVALFCICFSCCFEVWLIQNIWLIGWCNFDFTAQTILCCCWNTFKWR